MALTTICGAECGIVTTGLGTAGNRHWAAVVGAPAIETTVVRSGSKAFRFAAAATNPRLTPPFPTSQSVVYLRAYFRMSDATPASTVVLFYLDAGASASSGYISVTTGGVLYAAFNGTTGQQNGPTLADNTWYGIEAEVDIHANPNVIRWRTWDATNGWVSRTNVSVAQAASTFAPASSEFGIASGPTSGLTVYMDDVLFGAGTVAGGDYDTGASKGGKVLRYRPNADGTHSFTAGDFGYDAAGANVLTSDTTVYQSLDDDDQQSLTDFIRQKVIRTTGYVAVGFEDEAVETSLRAIAVTSTHHSSSTGANQQSIRISDDAWAHESAVWANDDVSDTTAHFRHKVVSVKPSDGGAWTPSALNALQARLGYSGDVTDIPYWDNISIEAAWTDVSGVSASAGHAPVTGAAQDAAASVAPAPGSAAVTGAAVAAAPSVKPSVGPASVAGSAFGVSASVQSGVGHAAVDAWASEGSGSDLDASAGHAPVAGTASDPSAAVAAPVEHAAVTGAAHGVTGATGAQVAAGHAAVTGAAQAPSAKIAAPVAHAAVTGSAHDVAPSVSVGNPLASAQATAVAFDATAETVSGAFASVEHAVIAGAAGDVAASLGLEAGHAGLVASAHAPTITTAAQRTAGHGAVTGSAYGVTAAVASSVGHAAGSVSVAAVAVSLAIYPEHAAAIAAAYPDQVRIAVAAGIVAVTGSAYAVSSDYLLREGRAPVIGILARSHAPRIRAGRGEAPRITDGG